MQSNFLIVLLLFFISCKEGDKKKNKLEKVAIEVKPEKHEDSLRDFKMLPKHLIMLTKIKEEWVVFNPCNASNGEIIIDDKKLVWAEGHEAEELFIKNVENKADRYLLDIESLGRFYKTGIEILVEEKQSFFRIRNKLYGGDKTRVFVAKNRVRDFKIIEQPCKECWDDCD